MNKFVVSGVEVGVEQLDLSGVGVDLLKLLGVGVDSIALVLGLQCEVRVKIGDISNQLSLNRSNIIIPSRS